MSDKKDQPKHEGRRQGGATRGGRHADRGGVGGTSRTAKTGGSKKIGRPPGEHRKGEK